MTRSVWKNEIIKRLKSIKYQIRCFIHLFKIIIIQLTFLVFFFYLFQCLFGENELNSIFIKHYQSLFVIKNERVRELKGKFPYSYIIYTSLFWLLKQTNLLISICFFVVVVVWLLPRDSIYEKILLIILYIYWKKWTQCKIGLIWWFRCVKIDFISSHLKTISN